MSAFSRHLPQPAPAQVALAPLPQLMALCDQVSFEAFATNSLGSYLSNKGAGLSHAFGEALRSAFTRDHAKPEVIALGPLQRLLATFDYTVLMEVVVNKPVGVQGNLNDYVQYLAKDPLTHLVGLIPMVLVPAQKRFAYYLNNTSEIGQRHKFEYGSLYSSDALEQLLNQQAGFVTEGNNTGTDTFGNLWGNKNEFLNTVSLLNELNQQRMRKAAPELVNREVQKLAQLAEALLTNLTQHGDAASSQFVAAITEEMRLVARWVEWYSMTITQILDFTTAMKHTEHTVMALIK